MGDVKREQRDLLHKKRGKETLEDWRAYNDAYGRSQGVPKDDPEPLHLAAVQEEMRRVFGEDEALIWPGDREQVRKCKLVRPKDHAVAVAENIAAAVDDVDEVAKIELDMVHLPPHYARYKIEPIRFIVENLGPTFLVGNIIKYVMRYPHKNKIEDCRKAQRYAEMLVKFEEGNPDWWR